MYPKFQESNNPKIIKAFFTYIIKKYTYIHYRIQEFVKKKRRKPDPRSPVLSWNLGTSSTCPKTGGEVSGARALFDVSGSGILMGF
jgi:hypothetical protein